MKKKLLIALMSVVFVFAFAACGSSESADTQEVEMQPKDYIKSIEFAGEEDGVAFWDVYLVDDAEWSTLGLYDAADIAMEAMTQCIARDEAPDPEHCWVDGYQDENSTLAFSWSQLNNDRISIYDKDGNYDCEYLLESDDYDKLFNAKK